MHAPFRLASIYCADLGSQLWSQEELGFNPFLRISQPQIVAYSGGNSDPVEVLAALRRKKDKF